MFTDAHLPDSHVSLSPKPKACGGHFLTYLHDRWWGRNRTDREEADVGVTLGIMPLYVLKLGRIAKGLIVPVEVAQPFMQIWIA
jgi:hypothetical protein